MPISQTTRQQEIATYSAALMKLPGTYQGNMKQYKGLTWAQLYVKLANSNQSIDAKKLGDAIVGIQGAQKIGQGIGDADNVLSNMLNTTASGSTYKGLNAFNPDSWLGGLGGMIATGIESGFVALLKDLWDVILGPLEILAGAVVAFVIIAYIFKDDLAAVAPLIAALA